MNIYVNNTDNSVRLRINNFSQKWLKIAFVCVYVFALKLN